MVGNFKKCKWCGGIYNYMGKPFCPNCIKMMDDSFVEVRNFVYENPNARVEDIVEGTDVDREVIQHFLREGRLELRVADGSLTCEQCGAPIASGKLCHKCSSTMKSTLDSTLPKPPPKPEKPIPGMASKSKLHVDVTKK